MYSAEPLPHFVDEYLSYLYEAHPTSATFDGVHLHDDLLEDWGRQAIDGQIRDLGGFARRLAAIDPALLTDTERLERPALDASIRARLFDLEEVRPWERNPQHYADVLATSLAGQALFDYAPLAERARRVLSKLRQVPRFMQAARDNIKDPPGIYVKVGLESMRGTLRFIDEDLPRAFGDISDLHLLGDLADASTEAATAIGGYIDYLERDLAPRSKGSFRLGRERFEQKLRLDEGITLSAERLLAIANRELQHTQEEFRRVASRVNGSDPVAAWSKTKDNHPPAGQLIPVAQQQLADLVDFINRQRIVTIPDGAPVEVAPTPRFYRWTFASMWTPGPFEARPLRAFYYITDVEPSWPVERKNEHLRDFNYGALWSAVRLGQLAEALIRLCRFIVGIRLHSEDLSVEQGVRFFRDEAFLEEATARREAERGTFDPSYILYSAGKLMVLKLREDYKAQAGAKYSLRGFHDSLLANGTVPVWLHRALMLGEQNGEMLV